MDKESVPTSKRMHYASRRKTSQLTVLRETCLKFVHCKDYIEPTLVNIL